MEKLRKKILEFTSFEEVKRIISLHLNKLQNTPCPVPDDSTLNDFDGSYKDWVKAKEKLRNDRNLFQEELEKSAQEYIVILEEWIINFYKSDDISQEEVEIIFKNTKKSYKLFYDFWERYEAIFHAIEETITLYRDLLKIRGV